MGKKTILHCKSRIKLSWAIFSPHRQTLPTFIPNMPGKTFKMLFLAGQLLLITQKLSSGNIRDLWSIVSRILVVPHSLVEPSTYLVNALSYNFLLLCHYTMFVQLLPH